MKVKDTERSENGPQRRKTDPASWGRERLLHACCICHRVGVWGDGWSSYYSLLGLDECKPIPKFCSANCADQAGPECENITEEMLAAAKALEMREPNIVYREATDREKYAAAVSRQPRK